jgi:hypothetical protein
MRKRKKANCKGVVFVVFCIKFGEKLLGGFEVKLIRTILAGLYFIAELYISLLRQVVGDGDEWNQMATQDTIARFGLLKPADPNLSRQALDFYVKNAIRDTLDDTQPVRVDKGTYEIDWTKPVTASAKDQPDTWQVEQWGEQSE